jgi:hypothetical protein
MQFMNAVRSPCRIATFFPTSLELLPSKRHPKEVVPVFLALHYPLQKSRCWC